MNIENREDYIRYRLKRAQESFEDALILAKESRWNAVINRLYYACFYAVIALLMQNKLKSQTHDGARTQFGAKFIKTGIIDKKFGKLYTKLFDFRQKGDYGDLFDFDEATVRPLIDSVDDFLKIIKKLINELGSSTI